MHGLVIPHLNCQVQNVQNRKPAEQLFNVKTDLLDVLGWGCKTFFDTNVDGNWIHDYKHGSLALGDVHLELGINLSILLVHPPRPDDALGFACLILVHVSLLS